jgi:hypothetical protein
MRRVRYCTVRQKWKIIGGSHGHQWGWVRNGKWWKRQLHRAVRQYDRAFTHLILLATDFGDVEPRPYADKGISSKRSVVDWKDW